MEVLSTVLILLITTVLAVLLVIERLKNRRLFNTIEKLPGDKRYPLFGTTLSIIKLNRKNFWAFVKERHRKYGPIYRSWIGSVPWVHIYKPDHIAAVLKSELNMGRGPILQKYMRPLVGDGLMFSVGEKWKFHKRMINPAFSPNMLDKYSQVFDKKGRSLAKILENRVGQDYFEIGPYIRMAVIDAVTETLMGMPSNSLVTKDVKFGEELEEFAELTIKRMYNPFYGFDVFWHLTSLGRQYRTCLRNIWNYTRQAIQKIREKFENISNEVQLTSIAIEVSSFLDVLLCNHDKNKFSEKEIVDEVTTFVSGAVDNISLSVSWVLFCLSNFPEVQKKLHEELDSALENSETISIQDIMNMPYLAKIIKETMRLYPTIIRSHRMLDEDIQLDGYVLPKGATVVWSIYDLHHDTDNYSDPEKFDPERFSPEKIAKRHPSSYAPFGLGVRNCMGEKYAVRCIKHILVNILRHYKVRCLETPEKMPCYAEIVLRPQNGIHLKLESRSQL